MKERCGCCEGTKRATPSPTANRPGLSALRYRVGTHAKFLETMKARLSNVALELPSTYEEGQAALKTFPLRNLKTRDADDPAVALLDAWATVSDVLTFYQERIANEGYLRTATERRSILELARLVGYALKPGVASSVYLAYTLDDKSDPVEIAAGARAQSVPAAGGELPQSFETSDPLKARKEWNDLKPRMKRPQLINPYTIRVLRTVYFEGTATDLKPNDPLLFVFENFKADKDLENLGLEFDPRVLRKVESVEPHFADNRTKVALQLSLDPKVSQDLNAIKIALFFILTRYMELNAFCVSNDGLVRDVFDEMDKIIKLPLLKQDVSDIIGILTSLINDLSKQEALAEQQGDTQATKWLGGLIDELTHYLLLLSPTSRKRLMRPVLEAEPFEALINLARPLSRPASLQPANSARLERDVESAFSSRRDLLPQVLTAFNPQLGTSAYKAWGNAVVTPTLDVKVYAMRETAPLFGHNAPRRVLAIEPRTGKIEQTGEWPIAETSGDTSPVVEVKHEQEDSIDLDGGHEKVVPGSWVIVDKSEVPKPDPATVTNLIRENIPDVLITKAESVSPKLSRADYGMTGQITHIRLAHNWLEYVSPLNDLRKSPLDEGKEFRLIRRTVVYAQAAPLALAEEPIDDDVCGDSIELGQLYDGLKSGRWLIVSGERADIPRTSGVKASELVMLADVEQGYDQFRFGDKVHSTLILANSLAYVYKRDTVSVYGNVVKATHGETRAEVLGGGDASKPLQQFTLKQPPLTYVSAPTTEGVASTLRVYVNEIEWHEADTIAGLAPDDRRFVTLTDDDEKTTVVFGNGVEGARLPTGTENVRAVYRNGIGRAGNVLAEQISLLVTRPLGVKGVINPLRASGGADKESRDQARRNVPLAVMSLDRLISTQDYEDFARTFAGIGKASAVRLSDGHRQLVHLTIAGTDDIPIDAHSDIYRNLREAFVRFGDPFQAVQVDMRELMALVISANVGLLPDYQWEAVEPQIRAALLYKFGFEQRELGQPVFLSEVISTIQLVRGVAYVDVDVLESISEAEAVKPDVLRKKLQPPTGVPLAGRPKQYITVGLAQTAARANKDRAALMPGRAVLPAQLAILLPAVPDTLILNLVQGVKR